MKIRNYQDKDEQQWIRCRVLAFLDTAYYDSVFNKKEKYENHAIELIAEDEGIIVGMLDIELDTKENKVCKKDSGLSGMIWHIGVHPDHRRKRIASELLKEGERLCKENNISRIEAWTRDDGWVRHWYQKQGFVIADSYLHVNLNSKEMKDIVECKIEGIIPREMFAHYANKDKDNIKKMFKRVNECVMFEKNILEHET